MNYRSKTWNPQAGQASEEGFLSTAAKEYLAGCSTEIYADWEQHFPSEKSLAGVLSRTVLKRLDEPGFAIADQTSIGYAVQRAFHHQKSMSDLLVDIFRRFNHDGISDFLIITQTPTFKEKFLYDSATMTLDTLTKHYAHFIHALELSKRPRIFFLALDDLDFRTDVLTRGTKKYLKLEVN